jgi:hypothetical protein
VVVHERIKCVKADGDTPAHNEQCENSQALTICDGRLASGGRRGSCLPSFGNSCGTKTSRLR